MTDEPISVPVDDAALNAIEHALKGAYTVENGEHRLVGADYSLTQLLDFWSGRDPGTDTLIGYEGEMPIYEASGPVLGLHDVIGALVAELRLTREAHAKWREFGQRADRALLEIWHMANPEDTRHLTYGDDIESVVEHVRRMHRTRAVQNALNAIMRASQASHVAIGRAGDFQDAVAVLRAELGITLPNPEDEAHFAGYEPEDLQEAYLHQPWEADLRRPHPIHANLGPSACPACGWDPLENA